MVESEKAEIQVLIKIRDLLKKWIKLIGML
jgi:hypothetical protein